MKIQSVRGRMILDSRGNPTVEADVVLDTGAMGRASVPSGASTGTNEAVELRDGDSSRWGGKGVVKAVGHVNGEIARALSGKPVDDQAAIDTIMRELDGTLTKSRLGANAMLAVSLAAVKAAAASAGKPLFVWLGEQYGIAKPVLPVPMVNIINGGAHTNWQSTDIQEFMIMPIGAPTFSEAVRMAAEIFHALAGVLKKKGYGTTVGDEGGFAPHVKAGNAEALGLISEAVNAAGYALGEDVVLALDVAASEFYKDGKYELAMESKKLSSEEMIEWLAGLTKQYPLLSVEDGLAEDDWGGWQRMTNTLGEKIQLVGDDLLVTNTRFLQRAITEKAGNAILIKLNQIGTVTETIEAVKLAEAAGWKSIISHRSGETEDVSISHFVVGLSTGQIKTGSMSRSERTAKYNELLRIEELLGDKSVFAGRSLST